MIRKEIDLTEFKTPAIRTLEGFGGANGKETYAATSRFLVRNGTACFPVMGEFHYSRYPAAYWEEELFKMKAGGIDAVSTYVFWNHHEEAQGCFDWSGNKNLRRFLELCGPCGVRVILRIGPWSHGECRRGGFPDWLVDKGIPLRQNSEPYLSLVRKFYAEIFRQAKGLLFSDGGPVVGVQIENEYGHCGGLRGEEGKAHIRALKKIAVEEGFRVPFYTVTGWGSSVVAEGETLPVQGGYAEAPWDQHIREREAEPGYLFRPAGGATDIGGDLAAGKAEQPSYRTDRYPYLMAELGGGLEPTHHRRPIVSGDDTGALAMAALGSGAALLGYYMYHGGTNPAGRFSTLQESKDSGGCNDVPELSYDFQAPIGEYGQIRESYGQLKAIHLFLHDFGAEMAESACFFPPDNPRSPEDTEHLRYSVRFGEKGGFLFLSNYQRRRKMTEKRDVTVRLRLPGGECSFEQFDLADGDYCFWPFHLRLGGVTLISAQAQLLCRLDSPKSTAFIFFTQKSGTARYRFLADGIRRILSPSAKFDPEKQTFEFAVDPTDFGKAVPIVTEAGKEVKILTICREDAYRAWKLRDSGGEYLLLSDACLYSSGGVLHMVSDRREIALSSYPSLPDAVRPGGRRLRSEGVSGSFRRYALECEKPERMASVGDVTCAKSGEQICCRFSVRRTEGADVEDDFLTVRFTGDRARLFLDGRFCADRFWDGTEWRVGLKRFGSLAGKMFRLEIEPLHEGDFVFLERKPEFQNGTACSVSGLSVAPSYHTQLEWDGLL